MIQSEPDHAAQVRRRSREDLTYRRACERLLHDRRLVVWTRLREDHREALRVNDVAREARAELWYMSKDHPARFGPGSLGIRTLEAATQDEKTTRELVDRAHKAMRVWMDSFPGLLAETGT